MKSKRQWLCLAFSLFLLVNTGFAQIDRQYQPVVLSGENTAALWGSDIKNMYLMSYNGTEDSWSVIAFQVDEVDSSLDDGNKYLNIESDGLAGIFDLDDELVFMARDIGGDHADSTQWADGTDSTRFEIKLVDPTDNSTGYVYACFSETPLDIPDNKYMMSYNEELDHITSLAYDVGFNETGLMSDLKISPIIGGNNQEVLDRVKVRLHGFFKVVAILPFTATESGLIPEPVKIKYGPVRLIRIVTARYSARDAGLDDLISDPFVRPFFFYPYSGKFNVTIPIKDFSQYADVLYARLTWDMNQNANGMQFFCENIQNPLKVDGSGDANLSIESRSDDLDWTMINGEPGTMLNVFFLPKLGDQQGIYFYDDKDDDPWTTGDPESIDEYIWDTGDSVSYGESGYYNFDEDRIELTELTLRYDNYFLPPSFTPEQAAILTEQLRQPLDYAINEQQYSPAPTTVTAAGNNYPNAFKLNQNYPNPFNASTMISFNLPRAGQVILTIYDVTGRQIRELVNEQMQAGQQQLVWDGRNDEGVFAPSGIYVYKLKMNSLIQSKKMAFIK